MKHTKFIFSLLIMLSVYTFNAKAAPVVSKTFNQVSGSGWGTGLNWGGTRPTGTDDVDINANCIMNLTGACNNLTINAGDTLFLVSGSNLTVNGNITMNGYIKVTGGVLTLNKNFLTIPGITYNKLVLGNGKSMMAGGPIVINNDLVIGNNTVLDDNNEVIEVKCNITNNGRHQSGGSSGKIVLNGTTTQTINSTFLNPFAAHCEFGNLELDNSNGARIGTSSSTNVVIEVTEAFSMTQGNLNVNGFTFIVGDPSTSTGVYNNAGNGTISGANNSWIVFMGDASAAAVNNLRVNTNGNVYLDVPKGVKLGGASTIASQLSLIHGILDQNGYDLNIGKSSANTGTILYQNNGALKNTGSTGTLTLSGSIGTAPFSNLKADSLAGLTINTPAGASLFGNTYIKNRLSIVKGFINLNGKDIELSSTGSLSEAAGQLVIGSGSIYINRNYSTSLINTNAGGLGMVLSTSSAPGATTVTRTHTPWTSNGNTSIKRSYNVIFGNSTNVTNIEFNYDSTELNGKNRANLVITNSTNAGSSWTSMTSCVASTGNFPTGKVTRYSTFAFPGNVIYTACEASNPLSPVFTENTMQEVTPVNTVSAYPNPTSNTFTVALNVNAGRYMFVITDISGRVLNTNQVETTEGMNNFNFDISEYPVGVYILTISNGTEIKNIKIQKQ